MLPRRGPKCSRSAAAPARRRCSARTDRRRSGEASRRAAGTRSRAGSTGARSSAICRVAVIGARAARVDSGAVEDAGLDRHRRDEGHAEAVVDHLHQRVERRAHHRCMRREARAGCRPTSAWSLRQWPSSSSSSRFSSIADDIDDLAARRLAARERRRTSGSSNKRRVIDLAAGVGQGEQHAVELAAVERLARRLAGLLAQVELRARAIARAGAAASRAAGTARSSGSRPSAARRAAAGLRARAISASSSRLAQDAHAPCRRSSRQARVKRTTRRVRSTRVTPSRVSSSRSPADSVDWVTKQASAALPKWPCCRSATRYCSCLMVGRWTVIVIENSNQSNDYNGLERLRPAPIDGCSTEFAAVQQQGDSEC